MTIPNGSMTRGVLADVLHNLGINPDHTYDGSLDHKGSATRVHVAQC